MPGDEPRLAWHPALGQVFGIKPWDMAELYPHELDAMNTDLKTLAADRK